MPRKRKQRVRLSRSVAVDPVALIKQLRGLRFAAALLVIAAIVGVALLDRAGLLLPVDDDWHRYHGQSFSVARVVDGDTLDLRIPDGEHQTTRVRLWGIDTPEMANARNGTQAQPLAQEATDYCRALVEGQAVTLYLQDHRTRGKYGRLLAYVQLPDGTVLNESLLEHGLARYEGRWDHDRLAQYEQIEQIARHNRVGLWAK